MRACGHVGRTTGCPDCEAEEGAALHAMGAVPPEPLEGLSALRVGPDEVLIVMLDGHRFKHEVDFMVAGMQDALAEVGLSGRSLVVVGPGIRFGVVPMDEIEAARRQVVHAIDCDLDVDCNCFPPEGDARVNGD